MAVDRLKGVPRKTTENAAISSKTTAPGSLTPSRRAPVAQMGIPMTKRTTAADNCNQRGNWQSPHASGSPARLPNVPGANGAYPSPPPVARNTRSESDRELESGLEASSGRCASFGSVTFRLSALLDQLISSRALGLGFGAESGFLIERNPDTVLAPDIAFVRRERIPPEGPPAGYWPGAPDLAVDVISPGDSARQVNEKTAAWLKAGCEAVWIINPRLQTVTVHYANGSIESLTAEQILDGGTLLPGFQCRVAEIFPVVRR